LISPDIAGRAKGTPAQRKLASERQESEADRSHDATKSGHEFDTSYDQMQLRAHRDAVILFEAYAKNGEDSELKTWAGKTLPHPKEHLSMAEKLK
jgi:predicted outer membrane protein